MSYIKENIFVERNIIRRGGVLMAGVGSCPWCEIPCMEGYWSGLACLASGLVLAAGLGVGEDGSLWSRETRDLILARPLTQNTDESFGKITLILWVSVSHDAHYYFCPANNISPRVLVTVCAPVVRRWGEGHQFLPPEPGLRVRPGHCSAGCSVLCQLGDCSTQENKGTMREETKSGIG